MPKPSSPFDEGYEDQEPLPRRKRRAWWRWNIVTLLVVLFLLAWARELLGISPLATWLTVFLVFTIWTVTPVFSLIKIPETMPDQYLPPGAPLPQDGRAAWRRSNGTLAFFKVLAVIFLTLSLLHLFLNIVMVVAALVSQSGPMGMGMGWSFGFLQSVSYLAQPSLEIIGSASMYLLAEIATRLDRPPWESRDED